MKDRFAWAREVSDAQVATATAFRERFRAHLARLLGNDGVLLMPTMPDIAPLASADEAGLEDYRNRATRLLCSAGLAGFPQLSLPLGARLGAPLGISLLGPAGSDRSLVRLAEQIVARRPGRGLRSRADAVAAAFAPLGSAAVEHVVGLVRHLLLRAGVAGRARRRRGDAAAAC